MRLALGLMTMGALLTLVGRADAVGRMPGNTAQWLGWGYGAGYHAPIVHAHPPVRRAVLHAPGGHRLGGRSFGPSCLPPHFAVPYPPPPVQAHEAVGTGRPLVELLPPVPPDGGAPEAQLPPPEEPTEFELPPAPSAVD